MQLALDEAKKEELKIMKNCGKKYKNYGARFVTVIMQGGTKVELLVTYYARPCKERVSKKSGVYPGLIRLGIFQTLE